MCVVFLMKVQLFSPAKINVFLSVLGPREDGFHEILSIVCPLQFGDDLSIEWQPQSVEDTLSCNDPEVPLGSDNLALKAVDLFRSVLNFRDRVHIEISKRIPMGGGMGGGSGNGAAVRWGLNELLDQPLTLSQLKDLAANLGSDCPLFLEGGAAIVEGRGEIVNPLPDIAAQLLADKTVFLLLPGISVPTAWAYGRFRELGGEAYDNTSEMRSRLFAFAQGEIGLTEILHINFERVVYEKYVALDVFHQKLQEIAPECSLLSGSGSTLFLIAPNNLQEDLVENRLYTLGKEAFGQDFELVKTLTAPFVSAPFVHRAYSPI
jgi:4-diphosphocytidyl-2-C-methyl-D-erythritol kinase